MIASRAVLAVVVLLSCGAGLSSHARAEGGGPPMITDDTATPGPGAWEINTAAIARHSHQGAELELRLIDLNYGVGDRLQLKYEASWNRSRETDGAAHIQLGESMLGAKWRFHDPGANGWKLSTYPQVALPHAGEGTTLILPLELDRELDSLDLTFEAGRELPSRGEGSWFAGAVAGHSVNEHVKLLAEAHVETPDAREPNRLALVLGMRWGSGSTGALLLSVGHEFAPRSADPATLFSYVGWQFTAE